MNIHRLSVLVLAISLLMFAACAGSPHIGDSAPPWTELPPEDNEIFHRFRGVDHADSLSSAKEGAYSNLFDLVIFLMKLGNQSFWTSAEKQIISTFRGELERAVKNPDSLGMDGVQLVRQEAWRDGNDPIMYAVEIQWDRRTFLKKRQELLDALGIVPTGFRDLEMRAQKAEQDGNAYESALLWATAAKTALVEDYLPGYDQALEQIFQVLSSLEYSVISLPDLAFVGARPDVPVVFSVSINARPVSNAEFLIRYPRSSRDGSPSVATARVLTDSRGRLPFLPPEVTFPGTQVVSIAPSAVPFALNMNGLIDDNFNAMVELIEKPAAQARYDALSQNREIPTGLLILDTDLTGNPIDSSVTVRGLLDNLSAEGFRAEVMNLDPREMLTRSEKALLRDVKADPQFADAYKRIIFGIVSLEGFEQDGDSFAVRVSGVLVLADIQRQVVIHRSDLTKTSRATDGQQAINAAFRQLGRSFANEIIDQVP